MDHPSTPAWSTGDVSLRYKVRLGLWTNWSYGSVLGQTLTMGRQEGDLLIAFTGVFITFVGARFWQIVALALHRCYSTPRPQDAFHQQRQIILRNSASADSSLRVLTQLLFAWRRRARIRWLLPAISTALFCIVAFTIAGGFSSQISSSAGTEVILDGTDCGILDLSSLQATDTALVDSYAANEVDNGLNYVQQCYSANSSGLIDCKSFVKERIPSYINDTAPCPFADGLCRSNSSNLILDTGYLNSHYDFGVNAPHDQRILFRRILQCAPLTTTGRTTDFQDEKYGNRTLYNYGAVNFGGSKALINPNYTYLVDSLDLQYFPDETSNEDYKTELSGQYLIVCLSSFMVNGTMDAGSDFFPDSDLARSDADIYLNFLSGNGVEFTYPTDDLWYRATTPFRNYTSAATSDEKSYRFDVAASPLACADQFQYCRSDTTSCGPLASSQDAIAGAFELFGISSDDYYKADYNTTNNPGASRFDWFSSIASGSPVYLSAIVGTANGFSLKSAQSLFDGVQSAQLPNNQWQLDMIHWWATVLSLQQSLFVETAHGSSTPAIAASQLPPTDSAQRAMCENQKIQTTDYASFNFFALLFTYIMGLVIITVSFTLDPLLSLLQRRFGYQRYSDLEWTANNFLHLHRLAHEEMDGEDETWQNCTDSVPTTKTGILLAPLDITDPEHPRLRGTTINLQPISQEEQEINSIESGQQSCPTIPPKGFNRDHDAEGSSHASYVPTINVTDIGPAGIFPMRRFMGDQTSFEPLISPEEPISATEKFLGHG